MNPDTGQCPPPRLRIGAYQTRTSLQSFAGETSVAVTLRSILPGADQLAWLIRMVRALTTRLTMATWPNVEPPCGRIAMTAPGSGTLPRAYLPAAWPHQVWASP